MTRFREYGRLDESLLDSTRDSGPKAQWHLSLLKPWVIKLASILFSACCLAAVVLMLRFCNGKPVPPPWYNITINAAVTAFSTGAHVTLAEPIGALIGQLKWRWFSDERNPRPVKDMQSFDSASKGPLGSFLLLTERRLWSVLKGRQRLVDSY